MPMNCSTCFLWAFCKIDKNRLHLAALIQMRCRERGSVRKHWKMELMMNLRASHLAAPIRSAYRLLGLTGVALTLAACGAEDSSQPSNQRPAPVVTVEPVQASDAKMVQEYPARVRGAREVEVRARISGVLLERSHEEGSEVQEGDLLFRIDPTPMNIQLKQAEAAQANAVAEHRQAQRDWERAEQLFERGALSASERDRIRSQLDFAEAGLARAQAEVDEAKLTLSYTKVLAPLSGSTSLEVLPEGSLLSAGSLLTTIVQQDPVHVIFALPERDAAIQRTARVADKALESDVELVLPDGSVYSRPATVDFTSSRIDNATGTITVRAVVENPDRQLIPGQFVRARVLLRQFEDQIIVPTEAVGADARGPNVWVVDAESKAELRPVRLGTVIGDRQVIEEGLQPGDRVVVNGQVGLQPGMAVRIADADPANAANGE